MKSRPFYKPKAWKSYPFQALPPRIVHYREYHPTGCAMRNHSSNQSRPGKSSSRLETIGANPCWPFSEVFSITGSYHFVFGKEKVEKHEARVHLFCVLFLRLICHRPALVYDFRSRYFCPNKSGWFISETAKAYHFLSDEVIIILTFSTKETENNVFKCFSNIKRTSFRFETISLTVVEDLLLWLDTGLDFGLNSGIR